MLCTSIYLNLACMFSVVCVGITVKDEHLMYMFIKKISISIAARDDLSRLQAQGKSAHVGPCPYSDPRPEEAARMGEGSKQLDVETSSAPLLLCPALRGPAKHEAYGGRPESPPPRYVPDCSRRKQTGVTILTVTEHLFLERPDITASSSNPL